MFGCIKKSTPGYTYIKNNISQTISALGGTIQPGSIILSSAANNITISGNSLVVNNCGTYLIDLIFIGTASTASSTVIPTISVNGTIVSAAPVASSATPVNSQYEIKTILTLRKGDVLTFTNTGASAVSLATVNSPAYNMEIIIERFN